MTMWEPLKLLIPAYGIFWISTVCLAAGFWFAWIKIQKTKIAFNWQTPVLFATFFSLVFCGYNFMTIYNGNTLYTASNAKAQNQQQTAQQPMDPVLKMKADFLAQIEGAIQNPKLITKEFKTKLFKDFSKLFSNKDAKQSYKKAISEVYGCQKVFWEDALAAYKTKHTVKSDSRKECENLNGEFFNRPKMIPEETAKVNDKLMEQIASNQRLPASDGKTVELSEKMVQSALEAQRLALEAVNSIFE